MCHWKKRKEKLRKYFVIEVGGGRKEIKGDGKSRVLKGISWGQHKNSFQLLSQISYPKQGIFNCSINFPFVVIDFSIVFTLYG